MYGDQEKTALVTYPDIALNRECLVSWTSIMTIISSQFLYYLRYRSSRYLISHAAFVKAQGLL